MYPTPHPSSAPLRPAERSAGVDVSPAVSMTGMKLYADAPARRTRQQVTDLLLVAWIIAWVVIGRAVHGAVLRDWQSSARIPRVRGDAATPRSCAS